MHAARIYSRFPSRICAGEADEDSKPARIARAAALCRRIIAFSCRPALEHAGRPRDRSAPWTVDRRILGTIVIDRRSSDADNALILRSAAPCRGSEFKMS